MPRFYLPITTRRRGDVQLVGSSHGDDFAPRDEVGHGSHVGGIIGAHGWRLPPGVAGRSMLLPLQASPPPLS